MYGYYLTAKVRAEKKGGVAEVQLNEKGVEALKIDPRHVWRERPENHPARYGMKGDFRVVEDAVQNAVVAMDGTRFVFTDTGVAEVAPLVSPVR